MPRRWVIRGGAVVDGFGDTPQRADVALVGDVIESVGRVPNRAGDDILDATGRVVMPGFIDAHSHADAAVFRDDVQRGLLRQGVTTVIAGQDGVSFAPGDGNYASDYFRAINGTHPTYTGGGVGELLTGYDGTTAVNVGYLIPAGTVRFEVLGYRTDAPTEAEIARMRDLVKLGMEQGALGISTGLDYAPGMLASTAEISSLCVPVAAARGLYVTHMRGGYESNCAFGLDEVAQIATSARVRVHVSHLHGPPDDVVGLVDQHRRAGIDLTFDSYPYRRGCTLLAMLLLPQSLTSGPKHRVLAGLDDVETRRSLIDEWFPSLGDNPYVGNDWPSNLTLASIRCDSLRWAEGLTVRAASARAGLPPAEFVLDVLAEAELDVTAIVRVPTPRRDEELARLISHPAHLAGSDGIFLGSSPHPRAWGTFTRYLRRFGRERGDLTLSELSWHLSGHAAQRFQLGERGLVRAGQIADLVVVDPDTVADLASYSHPRRDSVGIDDVFVAGVPVLRGGELTGVRSGRGIRRTPKSTTRPALEIP